MAGVGTVLPEDERLLALRISYYFLFCIGPVELVLAARALSGEEAVAETNRALSGEEAVAETNRDLSGLVVVFLIGANLFTELPLF